MIVLGAKDVVDLLPMGEAIAVVGETMKTVSRGETNLPLPSVVEVGGGNRLGIMPGAMLGGDPFYGVKLLSLFPGNPARGLSSHLGIMTLFEAATGQPTALLAADALTAIRTAAASAVATRALARPDARVLAIVGTGEQAGHHVEAMVLVRDIAELRIAGRTPERAAVFAEKMRASHAGIAVETADTVGEAVAGADIVCTVTSSKETVLQGAWIAPGTHINAVGASVPTMREIDEDMVAMARLFTDYRPSAFAQAADIVTALESGRIAKEHVLGEIGELLAGEVEGRISASDITLYRSLGLAAQDLACGGHIVEKALRLGRGTHVNLE